MKDSDFAKELIDILDQSMNLIRQELVTLRNDVIQQKIEISTLVSTVKSLKDNRNLNMGLVTVIAGGIIAGFTAVTVEIIKFFKGS